MSKLIVEMEMPNRCYDCDLEYGASCMAMGGIYGRAIPQMTWIKTRPLWCPIKGEISEIELMHLEEERAFDARNITAERRSNNAE